MTNYGRQHT